MTLDDLATGHIDIVVALLSSQDDEKPPARQNLRDYGIDGWDDLTVAAERRVTTRYRVEDDRLYAEHIALAQASNAVPVLGARTREEGDRLHDEKRTYEPRISAVMRRREANARALLARTRPLEQLTIDDYLGGPA